MSKAKVFVTREIPQAGLQQLKQHFAVEVWPDYAPPTKAQLIEKIGDADGMLSLLSDKIDAETLAAAPKLKFIAQYAVGYDNIDVAEASRRGICVSNTPDVLTEASADFAFAQLMAVARRVVESDKYVRSGQWQVAWHPSMMLGYDIYGTTIGIIGAGRIGQALARRARGFAMKVLYYSSSPKPEFEKELGARRVELDSLFRESDFVSLHVPLNAGTRGLINAEKLSLMKKTAFLINNSRGPVVDEKALYDALKSGKIAGAALDVFASEPTPAENPLLTLENVVVAPHVSSASHATRARMAVMAAENLVAYFAGKRPANLVNPETFKK
ncbi:MAG: D-glycerate dehydrogenase [Candidatus Riflebacteria bacterium HGW-Riflebacteria-1]|jgi:glyoxylate reductase|nr:MAG: D-glycerate dehydrogenase [Candidatus Riflebacteria bacterium HGW-Riflebacteria-1]